MILVVGATGFLGGTIARHLLAKGQQVRALVRSNSAKAADLAAAGAEIAFGDLLNHASLAEACRGVSGLVSTASAMSSQNPNDTLDSVDRDGQCALVDAAASAKVGKFVYVSSPEQPESSPLQTAKLAVEARIRSAVTPFTILRPSFLTEVWLSPPLGFDYVEGRVRVYGTGENPISWISLSDVSRVAVWALSTPSADRVAIDLGGREALTPSAVIATFERVAGRPFQSEKVPEVALREQYNSALDARQRTFFAVALQYARGHQVDLSLQPSGTPKPIDDVEIYARRVLGPSN